MFSQIPIPIRAAVVGFLVALVPLGFLFWKWRFQGRKKKYPPSYQERVAWVFGLACCIIGFALWFWLLPHVTHYFGAYEARANQIFVRLLFAHKPLDSFFNFLIGAVLGPVLIAPILFPAWLVTDGVYLVSFRVAYKEMCARRGTPAQPPGD